MALVVGLGRVGEGTGELVLGVADPEAVGDCPLVPRPVAVTGASTSVGSPQLEMTSTKDAMRAVVRRAPRAHHPCLVLRQASTLVIISATAASNS
ncbi:hypothetical protein LL946_02560 [Knoellia locipacati]|uniref:hypothetical protein n=1 Tax=Knoellia locipacati TaxID=882824 RepID=UPI0038506AC1